MNGHIAAAGSHDLRQSSYPDPGSYGPHMGVDGRDRNGDPFGEAEFFCPGAAEGSSPASRRLGRGGGPRCEPVGQERIESLEELSWRRAFLVVVEALVSGRADVPGEFGGRAATRDCGPGKCADTKSG